MALATSPGSSWVMPNVTAETSQSVKSMKASRRKRKLSTFRSAFHPDRAEVVLGARVHDEAFDAAAGGGDVVSEVRDDRAVLLGEQCGGLGVDAGALRRIRLGATLLDQSVQLGAGEKRLVPLRCRVVGLDERVVDRRRRR